VEDARESYLIQKNIFMQTINQWISCIIIARNVEVRNGLNGEGKIPIKFLNIG